MIFIRRGGTIIAQGGFIMPKRKTTEQFKREVYDLVGNEYTVLSEYANSKTKVKMKHNICGHSYKVRPNDFLRGNKCPFCYGTHKKTTEQFKQEIKALVGNDYTVLGNYKNNKTRIKMKHNVCGNTFEMAPSNFLLQGQRCPICANLTRGPHKDLYKFKQEVKKLVGDEYTVTSDTYKGNKFKISIRHNVCGHSYKVRPNDFTSGYRCPFCSQSHGESYISRILDKYHVTYVYSYKASDLVDKRKLHYDFFIPDQDILIEYQGGQHYYPIDYFGGEKNFKKQQRHDQMKREYAKDHNYNLIEVPYTYKDEDSIADFLQDHGLDLSKKVPSYDPSNIIFREVSATEIKPLMLNYHYLHRQVATKFAYGLYYNDQLMGMVTYSGVRKSLAGSISDQASKDNTLELSRLFIKDEISQNIPNITSEFVGWSLRQLKQHGNWFIISFADSGMNHVGAIYQATNFIYCGTTNPGILCYNGPDRKGGQWKAGHHYRFFLLRTTKYRYIKFIGSKTFKKQARKTLKFEINPYPKQDTKHYHMGDTEERLIKDRKTGKIYPEDELLLEFPDYDWNGEGESESFKAKSEEMITNTKYLRGETVPIYVISTKTKRVYFFKSIKLASHVLKVNERNLRRCLTNHKGSLGGFVFCLKEEYSKDIVDSLIEQAKKSSKYKRDFIADDQWFIGSKDVRDYLEVKKYQLYRAMDKGLDNINGHSFRVPNKKEIKKHYLAIENDSDLAKYIAKGV